MKLTKGVISRDEANKLAPDFVQWAETHNFDILTNKVIPLFEKLKVGQQVLAKPPVAHKNDGAFVICKVTSSKMPNYDADGPVVRIGNGEATWRVDGSGYCYPIAKVAKTSAPKVTAKKKFHDPALFEKIHGKGAVQRQKYHLTQHGM